MSIKSLYSSPQIHFQIPFPLLVMELGLSLGDSPIPPPGNHRLSLCTALGLTSDQHKFSGTGADRRLLSLQLNLLPNSPVQVNSDNGSSETEDGFVGVSSPNSAASSFQMDFGIGGGGFIGWNKTDVSGGGVRAASENENENENEDENALARKKLRLSKEQSAFLEESFKEHNTLNPKQKLGLAKQLNLRPRQVEVWFQNRRARTKLKQTEVDCEYLKRCCETLTEENKRLHKELQELRALKSSNSNPFLMQLPATTLTMCPSCERVATATATTTGGVGDPVKRPMFFPFNPRSSSSSAPS